MSSETKYGDMLKEERVHRATDEFPAGSECDLTCDDVPDNEDGFDLTGHYEDRRDERRSPQITDEVIDLLLNNSTVLEAPRFENRYLFQREISGYWSLTNKQRSDTTCLECKNYEWTLVVADDGKSMDPRFALITVYSNYHGSVGTTNKYFDRLRQRRGDRL